MLVRNNLEHSVLPCWFMLHRLLLAAHVYVGMFVCLLVYISQQFVLLLFVPVHPYVSCPAADAAAIAHDLLVEFFVCSWIGAHSSTKQA